MLGMLLLTAWSVVQAGEFVCPEHGFQMVWPSRWEQLTGGSHPNLPLFLSAARETQAFMVLINPDVAQAAPFLQPKDIPLKFMDSVSGKEVLADTPGKVAGVPARRVVYRQTDDGIAVLSIVVAQHRAYLLIGTFKGMKQKAAEQTYDSLLPGFRLTGVPAVTPARPPAPVQTTPPVQTSTPPPLPPPPSGPGGSDF
ncbi:MAG: hypothetical protein OZSIB_1800 [Candidatus Ozemobacter sibiricus]|jgi:hypothetical protein|uniref:Uncharacterized protein n=1 Tax=Candidatus Ozemobacter sibiricus TaxID=2268124 RepID=A0A367ZL97_9BACT|nr:MAG: hypothetical protein OZSIB_1800 [Candidatus Ozemobacter sibiricus]